MTDDSNQIGVGNDFLHYFLKNVMYLQNPPMVTEDFISFSEKLGVDTSQDELEFFEKEKLLFPIMRLVRPIEENEYIKFKGTSGREYMRPVEYGLQEGETEMDRIKVRSYSAYNMFKDDKKGSFSKDLLLHWLKKGYLFDPCSHEFQSWDSFRGEELEGDKQKIVSFYSNFQIWQLPKIKRLTEITFTHEISRFHADDRDVSVEEGKVYLDIKARVELYNEEEAQQLDRPLNSNQEIRAVIERFKRSLDLRSKKEAWGRREDFNKFLKYLLAVQSIYIPFAKSGSGKIQLAIEWEKWNELKQNFNLDSILKMLDLRIEDIAKWYKILAEEALRILGIKRDDWVQLFESISWGKKDELEGSTRLGLEYLHWAIMLKKILEVHIHKKVLDLDEMSSVAYDDVLKYEQGMINRKRDAHQDKEYYFDRHKKLFYLANDFGLDYQPRVTVYVEGKTEEVVFPGFFENYFGYEPEKLGVEFISIKGISQFFGRETSLRKSTGSYERKIISNFNNLASYNLNKWQIIPYFIGDNENDIKILMQSGVSIYFNGKQYSFPRDWQYMWGATNNNRPYRGKDFEMANFNDEELAAASSEVSGKQIKSSEIKSKRDSREGLKQVNEEISKHKVDLARKLYSNLLDKYERTNDDTLFERPIFDAFSKIRELAVLNHPPVSREIQLKNKEYIEGILEKGLLES
ncbi:MAG: TOPRIM nucleotidyl transferase/hydrolase domain-containing protein [Thiobacillus sp.]